MTVELKLYQTKREVESEFSTQFSLLPNVSAMLINQDMLVSTVQMTGARHNGLRIYCKPGLQFIKEKINGVKQELPRKANKKHITFFIDLGEVVKCENGYSITRLRNETNGSPSQNFSVAFHKEIKTLEIDRRKEAQKFLTKLNL